MAITSVQTCSARAENSAAAVTPAFAANVTAGGLIVVSCVTWNGGTITVTVTDSLGNTYTQAGSYSTNASQRASVWYAKNISGGACTVTVTPSATAYTRAIACEYSGADTSSPLDGTVTNSTSSATLSTGSVSVSAAGGLVFGSFGWPGSVEVVLAGAGGIRTVRSGTNIYAAAVDLIADSAAAVSFTTTSSVAFCAVGASFKAAAAAAGGAIGGGSLRGGLQ